MRFDVLAMAGMQSDYRRCVSVELAISTAVPRPRRRLPKLRVLVLGVGYPLPTRTKLVQREKKNTPSRQGVG